MRFTDRVAIVTGSAHGIGAATARALAREGGRVALVDVDEAAVEATARDAGKLGGEALALRADVTRGAEVAAAVDTVLTRWGRIDVLVNNAGGFPRMRRTEDIDEVEWDTILRFNVTSAFLCARAVLPAMRVQSGGRRSSGARTTPPARPSPPSPASARTRGSRPRCGRPWSCSVPPCRTSCGPPGGRAGLAAGAGGTVRPASRDPVRMDVSRPLPPDPPSPLTGIRSCGSPGA